MVVHQPPRVFALVALPSFLILLRSDESKPLFLASLIRLPLQLLDFGLQLCDSDTRVIGV